MKYVIYSSKYEAILKMGMEECSLDFFPIRDRPFVLLVGVGGGGGGGLGIFSQQVKLEVKAFIFCNRKSFFLQLLSALHNVFIFSFIK